MAKEKNVKTPFAWDTTEVIRTIEKSEKERHEIQICTLNGKTFVVDTKLALFQKDGWKPVKNTTMPLDIFEEAYEAVGDWKLTEAFDKSSDPKEKKDIQVKFADKQKKEKSTKKKAAK
jgi:hypothetical protein